MPPTVIKTHCYYILLSLAGGHRHGLAIIAAATIVYVRFVAAPAPPEAAAATDEAPMALYWIMLLVGVAAAVAGFVMARRPTPR